MMNELILPLILFLTPSICRQLEPTDEFQPTPTSFTCKAAYSECEPNHLCPENLDIINTCSAQYTNEEIIEKCRNFETADFIEDYALFAPITCTKKNITYWNVYCGICNFEKELYKFEFWNPWLSCRMIIDKTVIENLDSGTISVVNVSANPVPVGSKPRSAGPVSADPVDKSEMLAGLKVDINNNSSKLISVFNDSIYQCNVLRVLSIRLKAHVPKCLDYRFTQADSAPVSEIFRKSVSSHFQTQNNPDQQTETKFCLATASETVNFCEYRNEYGESCSLNLFLDQNLNYTCNQNGYFVTVSPQDESILNECTNHTSKRDHIYVCGPTEDTTFQKIKNSILNVMDHISAFLLLLYLIICTNKQNLRSLPKRIFYSYSISLLALYLCDFILKQIKSCVTKYYIFFYVWQSHSSWILITSYDLWRIVHNSLKLQTISVERQTKRFLVYCSVGWGLPGLLLAVLFPTLRSDQKSWSCPSVSGFQNELICSSSCELNKYTYQFGWITIVIFLVLAPCLLLLTCVFVCLSTRNRARSNVNRTYTVAMIKVAVMMGLHWMLLVYLTVFDSGEKFNVVYEFISSFHGSFVFFAFGLERNNLKRLRRFTTRSRIEPEKTQDTALTRNDQDVKLSILKDKIDNIDVEK